MSIMKFVKYEKKLTVLTTYENMDVNTSWDTLKSFCKIENTSVH